MCLGVLHHLDLFVRNKLAGPEHCAPEVARLLEELSEALLVFLIHTIQKFQTSMVG